MGWLSYEAPVGHAETRTPQDVCERRSSLAWKKREAGRLVGDGSREQSWRAGIEIGRMRIRGRDDPIGAAQSEPVVRKGLTEDGEDGGSPLRLPLGEGRPRGGRGRREEKRTGTRRFGLVYGDGDDLAQHMVFAFHGATRVFFYHSLFHPLLSSRPATAYSQSGARCFNTISPHPITSIHPPTHLYSRPRALKPMCLPPRHPPPTLAQR